MAVQHILVPIDFSPYADQALEYAIELAQKLQARLTPAWKSLKAWYGYAQMRRHL